ncbi:MAG: hypothetical protein A2103_05315 [Gammaproteobacteria bacterium GWF2_41_13]|nr:MAG: hypothetical protein A2103_05315 [Gammaproteobacteria bacterium GWF2_41_13]
MGFSTVQLKKCLKSIPSHYYVVGSGWLSRIVMAGVQVISIPLVLRFVGTEQYALFAVITGLLLWFNLADLGLGTSIQNHISLLRVQQKETTGFLNSLVIFVLLIGCVEVVLFSLIAPFLQHFLLHKLATHASSYLLIVAGNMYILAALFGIAYKIFFAQHRGYWAYFYQTISYIGSLALVLLLIFLQVHRDQLLWVLLGWTAPQMLFAFTAFLHAVPLRRCIISADFGLFKKIFSKAWQYSVNAVGAAFVLGIDYVIMSQLLNANDITVYNIFNRIFSFMYFGYSAVLVALWPVLAEHYADFKAEKYRQANAMLIRNGLMASLYVVTGTLVIFALKTPLLLLFSKNTLVIPGAAILLFGFYYITRVWTDTYATAIQSRNKIAFIAMTVPIQAMTSIVFLYYFSRWLGLNGILLGLALCFLITGFWLLPVYHYYSIRKMRIED